MRTSFVGSVRRDDRWRQLLDARELALVLERTSDLRGAYGYPATP